MFEPQQVNAQRPFAPRNNVQSIFFTVFDRNELTTLDTYIQLTNQTTFTTVRYSAYFRPLTFGEITGFLFF